jgi:hypothetical protein
MQNGFPPLTMEQQLEKLEEFGGLGCLGRAAHGQPLFGRMGICLINPVPVDQTNGFAFWGTMSATAIRYPKAIKARGEWRRQFQNVTDLVPTILEVTGVPAPDYVNGQKRKPIRENRSPMPGTIRMPKPTIPPSILKCWDSWACIMMAGPFAGKPYRIPWSVDPEAMANFRSPEHRMGIV